MKKILLTLILILYGCGYQPIYINKNLNNLEFKEIILEGEKDLNRIIVDSLSLKENKSNLLLNSIQITTDTLVEETSKNSKGQAQTYRTIITTELLITNNEEIIKNKIFMEDFSYNSRDNKFELVEYQDEVRDDIIKKIIEEIVIYLSI
mgnify:FL=1|tara:strand:- start:467 stop:913 length:447 start_codon:yes stop_codon:yes gene_type:complete